MIREAFGVMRDLPRLHEITGILIRYGLGDLVRRIGVAGVLERAGRILHWRSADEGAELDPPQRVRRALEELGPMFVKLGQVLATRVDLLPPHWIAELEKLHNKVPPVPLEALVPELERALGQSPFDAFPDLEATAFGSASIAQVHRARLADGTPVVLKIRRPGIRPKIEADLRIVTHIAELIEAEMPEARRYRPTQIVAEFARSLERELDFTMEARNVERIAKNFEGDPFIVIPRIFPEWTSESINVQEHVDGIPGTDAVQITEAGLDRRLLAQRGAAALLKMILVDGFFHADPHPGNVFYLPGNRIAMIDFGMVGRLSPQRRKQVVDLLAGFASMDEEAMLDVLLDWADEATVDEAKLGLGLSDLAFDYEGAALKNIHIGSLIRQFAAILRDHSILMPADLTLMFKALITMEGLGRQFDPDFRIIEQLTPLLERAIADRHRAGALVKRAQSALNLFLNSVTSVPRDLARLLRDVRRGKTRIDLDIKRLDHFGRQLDRTIDRATMGILTASLVIGSSIVMTVQGGPIVIGMPVFTALGLFGYVLAFINSAWIILGMWRSGKQ